MSDNTKIEWADATLDYANGCSRVSRGRGEPGRFLKISDVVRETSLSRATIYRLIARHSFPAPTRVGLQRVAWPEQAVEAWKNEQLGRPPS